MADECPDVREGEVRRDLFGIDLVYYGNQRQLEYDFIVAPGADPHRIAFDVQGAKRIRRDARGELVFKVGEDEIRWHKPVVYLEKDGTKQEIAAHYSITDRDRVGFELARYDTTKPLYIDPLIYSTYLGGSGDDSGNGIALDSAGNAYLTGYTRSINFPTKNPLQPANGGGYSDAFVTKINAAGSALVYSTYLGGSGGDSGSGIAVDGAGDAYIVGGTDSTDFPTKNPLQSANAGGLDAFVAELNPAGSALVYSTYLGGSGNDSGLGIALDSAGNAYVTGYTTSTNFPTTAGAFQTSCAGTGCGDAFVSKLNPTGSALVYSTFLGGSTTDVGQAIAVDSAGKAYVTGYTDSTDFPTKNPLQPVLGGKYDAFVTKFNADGSGLVYSTYYGESELDFGNGIAADSLGNAYVTGMRNTNCTRDICSQYAFVFKINPQGSAFVYGNVADLHTAGNGIAVDSADNAYVIGSIGSYPYGQGGAFVERFDHSGLEVGPIVRLKAGGATSGYGIATDGLNRAFVTGATASTTFPTKNPIQPAIAGGYDAFVAEIDMRIVTTTTLTSSLNPSTYGQAVTFTATVTSSAGAPPDGETVSFMKGTTILGTGTLSGGSASFTTSTLPATTNSIKAVYGGDANLGSSTSNIVKQVVNKATTTTTLTSSLNPSNFGQSVTFTASITPQFGGTIKGTVTFYDGTTALKTVSVSGGVAKFTTSTLAKGTHTITGTYNGSGNFTGSSASLTQTVN